MRVPLYRFIALCLPFLAATTSAWTQQPAAGSGAQRPRIGLVLSGGGARGAAHVGVLKVLEELRVPVDAIAGTSMGAVVGGLYASGLTVERIEHEMTSIDWEDAFRDRPARSMLNFRRRAEDADFLVQLPLGFREGRIFLPTGLIQGQKLSQMLRELTLPTAGVTDFDALPTPFRAVATDLETGEAVVIGEGDLASALRASLSAPGIFAPVEREGRLLVDGGIVNNLPVDVARSMGVDRLIVVDVSLAPASRERLASVGNVTNQMLTLLLRRQSQEQLANLQDGDVLVQPALGDTSSFSFTRLAGIVEVGQQSAEAARAQLAAFSLPADQYAQYQAARHREPERMVVRAVQVDEGSGDFAFTATELFGDLAGSELDVAALRRRIARHYGQGRLELLDYRLTDIGTRNGR